MTIDQLKEDIELVAVEFYRFNKAVISIELGIIPVKGWSEELRFISQQDYLKGYQFYFYNKNPYDLIKSYHNVFRIILDKIGYYKEEIELEEFAKKISIHTGLNLVSFLYDEIEFKALIYLKESQLKFTLVDPLNPNLKSLL